MRQLTPRLLVKPRPLVDSSEAQVAPGLERGHPELLGEDQGRRVILERLLALRRIPVAGDLAQEEERARLVPARALPIRDVARLPDVPAGPVQPAGREMRLARVDQSLRVTVDQLDRLPLGRGSLQQRQRGVGTAAHDVGRAQRRHDTRSVDGEAPLAAEGDGLLEQWRGQVRITALEMHAAKAVVGPDALLWTGSRLRDADTFAAPGDRLGILADVTEAEGQPGAAADRRHEAASAEALVDGRILQRSHHPAHALDGGSVIALGEIHSPQPDADPDLEPEVAERGGDGEGAEPRLHRALEGAPRAPQGS